MKNSLRMGIASLFMTTTLTACIVPTGHGDYDVILPPPLPVVIDLGPDRYYQRDGYYYFYEGDRWQYSRDRNGYRYDLPRSHWPHETRPGRDHGYDRR